MKIRIEDAIIDFAHQGLIRIMVADRTFEGKGSFAGGEIYLTPLEAQILAHIISKFL